MSKPVHTIEIDSLVLTDLGLMPERAERLRVLVEMELQHLLAQGGFAEDLTGGDIPHLVTPTIHLDQQHNESHLANSLAQSIAQALRGGS